MNFPSVDGAFIIDRIILFELYFRQKMNETTMKILILFLFSTIFFLPSLAQAQKTNEWEKVFNDLVKKSGHEKANLGLLVEDGEEIVFAHNADKQFVPASLTKLVTAGALLKNVPLSTKFKTTLLSSAKIEKNDLVGDLCLLGGGDPSFVSEKMWFLVNEFTRLQVKKIKGDIIVDGTRFDREIFDSGRDSLRVDRAYDAPISALSFNWNAVNVFVRPSTPGSAPQVFVDPENTLVEIENHAKTVNKDLVKSILVERKTKRIVKNGKTDYVDVIVVSGNIGKATPELVFYKSITDPEMWSGAHLVQFLKQRGITVSGTIKAGSCQSTDKVLAEVSSKNFSEMVADMLKFSNNFVAEMLVKNLGALNGVKPSTMNEGIEVLKKYLDELGMKRESYALVNVSGLTRDNKFSVNQLNTVLKRSLNDFDIYPEFVSGLAISGVDGTLKSRFKNMANPPKIRAKTGYLDGIVGLSGYLDIKGRRPLVFTFIYNGGYEKALSSRDLFDDFLIKLNEKYQN